MSGVNVNTYFGQLSLALLGPNRVESSDELLKMLVSNCSNLLPLVRRV